MRQEGSGLTDIYKADTDQHNDENRDHLENFVDHSLQHPGLSFEIIIFVAEMWTGRHLTSGCDEDVHHDLHQPGVGPDHVLLVSMVLVPA